MGRCCCGRYDLQDGAFISNNTMHEVLGPEGNFCGPIVNHELRDVVRLQKQLATVCLETLNDSCTCDSAYKIRQKTDPGCEYCNIGRFILPKAKEILGI